MFRNMKAMAQLRDALTDKILIFGYLEQADTPFPIYTIICKYCHEIAVERSAFMYQFSRDCQYVDD